MSKPKQYRGAFAPESWHDESLPSTVEAPMPEMDEIERIKRWAYEFQAPNDLVRCLQADLRDFQTRAGCRPGEQCAVPRDPVAWIQAWAVRYRVWVDH